MILREKFFVVTGPKRDLVGRELHASRKSANMELITRAERYDELKPENDINKWELQRMPLKQALEMGFAVHQAELKVRV